MATALEDVYCTLLMSDSYLPGAAVLAHSLRDSGTDKKLAALVTLDSLLSSTITELKKLYDYVIPVDKIPTPNIENLSRLDRLDLRFAFTKIALWRQSFRKIVYIDADVVALRAPDELFDLKAPFAAAPDIGWPDIFNSGVMALTPNMGDFWSLQTFAASGTSFDGADQGLLNEYFGSRPWHRLSFTYNCTPSASYQYEPAYRHFRSGISMVHFIGKEKPWNSGRASLNTAGSSAYKELLGRWWAVYDRHYRSTQSSALGQVLPAMQVVQQYVKGENSNTALNAYVPPSYTRDVNVSQGSAKSTYEKIEGIQSSVLVEKPEQHQQSHSQPERQPFQAPPMDWDATKSEPPRTSRPEASGFPTTHYGMSSSTTLFEPPKYPEPPKDMYYRVPEIQPTPKEPPKQLFPWEKNARKATRVFSDNKPVENAPQLPAIDERIEAPPAQTFSIEATQDPWDSFTRTNAWDQDSSIDGYVRSMKEALARRGKIEAISFAPELLSSPPVTRPSQRRRESLILTDFPTEIERPSLPVTPAPVPRPSFWGSERQDPDDLPVAEGVPDQAEWNPHKQLEQLRRSSLIAAEALPSTPTKELPKRDAPDTAAPLPISQPEASMSSPQSSDQPNLPKRDSTIRRNGLKETREEERLDEYSIA